MLRCFGLRLAKVGTGTTSNTPYIVSRIPRQLPEFELLISKAALSLSWTRHYLGLFKRGESWGKLRRHCQLFNIAFGLLHVHM